MQDSESGILLDGVNVGIVMEQEDIVLDGGGGDQAAYGAADCDTVPAERTIDLCGAQEGRIAHRKEYQRFEVGCGLAIIHIGFDALEDFRQDEATDADIIAGVEGLLQRGDVRDARPRK